MLKLNNPFKGQRQKILKTSMDSQDNNTTTILVIAKSDHKGIIKLTFYITVMSLLVIVKCDHKGILQVTFYITVMSHIKQVKCLIHQEI